MENVEIHNFKGKLDDVWGNNTSSALFSYFSCFWINDKIIIEKIHTCMQTYVFTNGFTNGNDCNKK